MEVEFEDWKGLYGTLYLDITVNVNVEEFSAHNEMGSLTTYRTKSSYPTIESAFVVINQIMDTPLEKEVEFEISPEMAGEILTNERVELDLMVEE